MVNISNSDEHKTFNNNTTNKSGTIRFIPGFNSISKATPTVSIALNSSRGTTDLSIIAPSDIINNNSISSTSSHRWLPESTKSYPSLRDVRTSFDESLSSRVPNKTSSGNINEVAPVEFTTSNSISQNEHNSYQETLTDLLSESFYSYTPSVCGMGKCGPSVVSNELPNIFNKSETSHSVNEQRLISFNKNFFIISDAGKPIFTMHTDDKKIIPLAGIINTIVNYFQVNQQAKIKMIHFRNTGQKFVFLNKEHIIIMIHSNLGESFKMLQDQCYFLYSYLISTLTSKSLERLFRNRSNFDLGTFLAQSDIENLNSICHLLSNNFYPDIFLNALQSNPIEKRIRNKIHKEILQELHENRDIIPRGTLLYGFLLIGEDTKMAAVIRPQGHTLYTHDIQLLFCLVRRHLHLNTMDRELWIPICFPKFNSSGFLYSYIKILSLKNKSVMVLLSAQKDAFFKLKLFGDRLLTRLGRDSHIAKIIISDNPCTGFSIKDIPAPLIHHFIFKSTKNAQYIMPTMEYNIKYQDVIKNTVSYNDESENNQKYLGNQQKDDIYSMENGIDVLNYQIKLQRYYMELHNSVMSEDGSKLQSRSVINFIQWDGITSKNISSYDDVDNPQSVNNGRIHIMGMVWCTPHFELYLISNNGVSDKGAISSSAKNILRWCQKYEQCLFIQNGAIF